MGRGGTPGGSARRGRAMSEPAGGLEVLVGGTVAGPVDGWRVEWLPGDRRLARLTGPDGQSLVAVVEGAGSEWAITLRGRRIPVTARTWRERMLADAESAAAAAGGPVDVKATLPGLVVAVAVSAGDAVAAGDPLLTIEAMKMQNEVRAPRDGTIATVAVASGEAVATGALLIRLD
jgi:acetyl/propionyl-CoA carboxylase alpha subunit